MPVTGKRLRRSKLTPKRRGRIKSGPPEIEDLAHFLNLDMARSDIQKRWHYFQTWKFGISAKATDADLKRYAELKLLTNLLEERDVQPGRPDLIEHLQSLQDRLKTDLGPILRPSSPKKNEQAQINFERNAGMRSIVDRFNQWTLRPRCALYSHGEIMEIKGQPKGWWCTHDPELPNRITKIDSAILTHS
jgi:hypothetical protein